MSDTFAICEKCGCFDAEMLPPEHYLKEVVKELEKNVLNFKDDIEKYRKLFKELRMGINKIPTDEYFCYECNQWTNVKFKFYQYAEHKNKQR